MKRKFAALLAVGLFAAASARADDWFKIGQLEAIGKGDAKEIKVGHTIAKAKIVCTEGSIIINGFVVRHDGKADYHKIGQRFNKGEMIDIDMSDGVHLVNVDGFRISDDGSGKYKIECRK